MYAPASGSDRPYVRPGLPATLNCLSDNLCHGVAADVDDMLAFDTTRVGPRPFAGAVRDRFEPPDRAIGLEGSWRRGKLSRPSGRSFPTPQSGYLLAGTCLDAVGFCGCPARTPLQGNISIRHGGRTAIIGELCYP